MLNEGGSIGGGTISRGGTSATMLGLLNCRFSWSVVGKIGEYGGASADPPNDEGLGTAENCDVWIGE